MQLTHFLLKQFICCLRYGFSTNTEEPELQNTTFPASEVIPIRPASQDGKSDALISFITTPLHI